MGYFTWTDARKEPRILKNGSYAATDKIAYGGFAKIVCPDNTEICEPYYEGYGMFDGKDVYDLVVDWNKPYLQEIFARKLAENPNCWGAHLAELARYYQNDDATGVAKEISRLIPYGKEAPYFANEWKRSIGIAIACVGNELLPYPIKITSTKWHKQYDELVPSNHCQ